MEIRIDGRSVEVTTADSNIVEVADRSGIGIPAPCYRSSSKSGCCQVCVVEVDGRLEYACCTAPEDGMEIVVRRPDLMELRRQRIADYIREGMKGSPCECGCSEGGSCCS